MAFQPGQSGNPSGRPKIPEATKKLLAEGADSAVKFWLETLRNEDASYTHRLTAAEKLAAYGFGKPKEIVDLDVEGRMENITIDFVKKFTHDCDDSSQANH